MQRRDDSKQLALTYFNRAANYYRQACYAQAVQHYLAGLQFDPVCVAVHADLAKAYEMLGCWNQALDCLNTALQLRPDDPIALRRKKRILEE
ncbi:tetratricopeptide repeat protein, partial [Candidatus Poribacteria bacterium]|nr:tetratricopeptide repeat protein [Candidatus Poribacteria bacterium]